jgi:hypothetical protein
MFWQNICLPVPKLHLMNRIPLFTLTVLLVCAAQQNSAQVIFNETFGQTTTRQTSSYMPSGSYAWGDPNGTPSQKQIENNHYAVIAPANIRDAWPIPAWWFWTGAEPVGNTWGGANNPSTPNGNADHTGNPNGAVLVVNAGTILNSFYRRTVTLVPGNTYRLSAWMYLVNPSSMISMRIIDPQDGDILGSHASPYYSSTGNWQQLVYEFTFPSTCAGAGQDVIVHMSNALSNDHGNDYYIDDIVLEQISYSGTNMISCPHALLALNRIDLSAAVSTDQVAVSWAVDDESDVQYYEVQKSTNGIAFETIHKVAVTTPNQSLTYKYNDLLYKSAMDYTASRLYYRIRAVKQDGGFQVSAIVSVTMGKNNKNIVIYPQPASSMGTVHIAWANQAKMTIRIFDLSGRIVKVINNAAGGGIRINDLKSGMYVAELTNVGNNTVTSQKFQIL